MDENQFWAMIETAWKATDCPPSVGRDLADSNLAPWFFEVKSDMVVEHLCDMIPALVAQLKVLSEPELLAFDRILERKLYEIDRSEIQKQTDGSDDGFLYARGFIVAVGKEYYDAVNAGIRCAMLEAECEDICYLPQLIYEKRFGEMRRSGISRETGSNTAGWPED